MILCLAAAQASIFNTRISLFLIRSTRDAFFCVIGKFLSANVSGNFLNFYIRNVKSTS